jgi:hypothetical protein
MKKTDQEKTAKKGKKEKKAAAKAERKVAKVSPASSAGLADPRTGKKSDQKKALKTAAKLLQKELDTRMKEMVKRIRKETKAKLQEVVKDATRRLDVDTEYLFEQALHSIVQHHENGTPAASDSISTDIVAPVVTKAPRSRPAAAPPVVAAPAAARPRPVASRPTASAASAASPSRNRTATSRKPAAPTQNSNGVAQSGEDTSGDSVQ